MQNFSTQDAKNIGQLIDTFSDIYEIDTMSKTHYRILSNNLTNSKEHPNSQTLTLFRYKKVLMMERVKATKKDTIMDWEKATSKGVLVACKKIIKNSLKKVKRLKSKTII